MKILVTGASSFDGERIAHLLLASGHTVVGVSRTPPGITHDRYTWHCVDLSDDRYVGAVGDLGRDEPFRVVVHCAPMRYLSAIREAVARQTGLILTGANWRQALVSCIAEPATVSSCGGAL